jgi:hypothetical protein
MGEERTESETRNKLDDDVDALFKLPLAEFTGARNDLAARLKRDGRSNDANLVKALTKPSISAWAVNQLYWKHRELFDRLLATSRRLRQTQSSHSAADLRGSLDARREVLSHLSDLATVLLRDADHSPTLDTLHRITTTLEAVSAYATSADGPTLGRLTQDVDPPGFGLLGSFIQSAGTIKQNEETRAVTPSKKQGGAVTKTRRATTPPDDVQKKRQLEEARRARIDAAKASLQEARRTMAEVRSRAQQLDAAQKKAHAELKATDAEKMQAEKQLRQAEERFKKASAASQGACDHAQQIAAEAEEAAQALEESKRAIEKASRELESMLKDSSA